MSKMQHSSENMNELYLTIHSQNKYICNLNRNAE